MTCRVVVLLSGSGTNLQAIIDQNHQRSIDVVAVISNRPKVKGLARAESAGIKTQCIDHTQFDRREAFDKALMEAIDQYQPDLVVLAGFMRILTPAFTQHYTGRMLNIHPSLLPLYQGLNTHQRALDAGDSTHGVSVHFVTEELDGGPVVLQAAVNIEPDDTAETLSTKVQTAEHIIYPLAIKWFAEGKLVLKQSTPYFNHEPIPMHGYRINTQAATIADPAPLIES